MVSLRPTLHNLGPSQKPKGLKTFRCSAALLRPTESTITIPYPGKHHYHICRFNIQHLHKSLPSKVTLGLKKKKKKSCGNSVNRDPLVFQSKAKRLLQTGEAPTHHTWRSKGSTQEQQSCNHPGRSNSPEETTILFKL